MQRNCELGKTNLKTYISRNCIRLIRDGVKRVAQTEDARNAYHNLVEKSVRQYPLGRTRYRLKDARLVDWIHLAQDMVQWRTLVNALMNLRFQ
jgi:hypothetical protein